MGSNILRLRAKLGNMGRAADFVVYPRSDDKPHVVILQSSSRICQFDSETGKGMLSRRWPGGAYFVHLTAFWGACPVTVPESIIAQALELRQHKGQSIGTAGDVVIIAG